MSRVQVIGLDVLQGCKGALASGLLAVRVAVFIVIFFVFFFAFLVIFSAFLVIFFVFNIRPFTAKEVAAAIHSFIQWDRNADKRSGIK